MRFKYFKNCPFSATFLESIITKIDGETKGVPISEEPSQTTSEGDAKRQTSNSFLEKLGGMRPDGEKNQAQ